MTEEDHSSRWLCHICGITGTGESRACSSCYKTACNRHLRSYPALNPESGLFEIRLLCTCCAAGLK